jgi:ADP-ribosyl-[dinitrogen reductase] hydrolase
MVVNLTDRCRGVLVGLACGDALGGPVEFMSPAEIQAGHPAGVREFIGGGWLALAPGEITDDTQMTRMLAESLAERGDLDMDDVAARFVEWMRSGPKDIGRTTRASLVQVADGVSWRESGKRALRAGAAAGNGSVMRCAPIAIRYRHDAERLASAARDSSLVTHADPRCLEGCVAICQAITGLLAGCETTDIVAIARAGLIDDETVAHVVAAPQRVAGELRGGGFVLETVQAAIWAVATHDSFEEAVVAAVGLGNDSDTTAAVTGALAGARWGYTGIPARWREQVQWGAELVALADTLREQGEGVA